MAQTSAGRRHQLAAHVPAAALPRTGARHVRQPAPSSRPPRSCSTGTTRARWRRAVRRVDEFEADAMILPWLHPVMAPPYRYFLRHVPKATARVVICHNVVPHEPRAGSPRALAGDAAARGSPRHARAASARRARRAGPRRRRRCSRRSIPLRPRSELAPLPTDERARGRARAAGESGSAAADVRCDPALQGRGHRAGGARARRS